MREVTSGPRLGSRRFALVESAELAAPLLLPAVTTPWGGSPLQIYAARVERQNAFVDQRPVLKALGRITTTNRALDSTPTRPRVGIILSEPEQMLAGGQEVIGILVDMLRASGCEPVLIPPMSDVLIGTDRKQVRQALAELVSQLDGLVGPGGADVHPRMYKERVTYAEEINYPRDRFEAELALAAMDQSCYMLGICRSHQLWNVARGGKLVQDVQREGLSGVSQRQADFDIEHDEPFVVKNADGSLRFENRVHLAPHSQISEVLDQAPSILTNSFHHQAVEEAGAGISVSGIVHDDETHRDTIEATEAWNMITTQFHPELMMKDGRFEKLTRTVARRAAIFRLAKTLRAEDRLSTATLLEGMAGSPQFLSSDFAWAKEVLGPRLSAF